MKALLTTLIPIVMIIALYAQNITYIDLTQVKFGDIPANSIFEEIKCVPLETHPAGLLNINHATYYLTDKYIIATASVRMRFDVRVAYLFDRETGAFIRQVSAVGQGPDEYLFGHYLRYGFDEKNGILFVTDSPGGSSCKGINIETNKAELIIKKPVNEYPYERFRTDAPWFLKDNVYISYCHNMTGKDKDRLIVHDKEGAIIKRFPNYLEYKQIGLTTLVPPAIFYYLKGQTYFKEYYIDTIYCVDEKNLTPHIVFLLGDKQPSYYYKMDADSQKGKYIITFVSESDSFVLFNFYSPTETMGGPLVAKNIKSATSHTGYYDKKSKQVYISSTADSKNSGFTATGLPVSFLPISINKNKEMISHIDPEELMKYKDKTDPKYKYLFQNIQEDDNPIVIIAKLKD